MSFTVLCTVVICFYGVIWFFDSFFKSCMHYPYLALLKNTGLKVGLLNFSWTTTLFNRLIYRWSNTTHSYKKWFTFGSVVTICLFLPFSLWTLLSVSFKHFQTEKVQYNDVTSVTVVLPGVNLPMSEFWMYFLALLFCSILHELGHALAAVQEDVQLLSVGVYVFTIIPIAFVQLSTEHLNSLSVSKRLRIYCAGVWHNIVTAVVALLLFYGSSTIFNLAYKSDGGVQVTELDTNSPLKGERGLEVGDMIVAINSCNVNSYSNWHDCLQKAYSKFGICTTEEHIAEHDEVRKETWKENNIVECCKPGDLHSFCFEYMEPKVANENMLAGQYSCLKPREMITDRLVKCTLQDGYQCPADHHCMKPSLNNDTHLIIIERNDKSPVLYLGSPSHVQTTVTADQYIPRATFFSHFSPKVFENLMYFLFIFSMGIGFINILPCYGADGHHIAGNLIQLLAIYFNKDSQFVITCTMVVVITGTLITWPTVLYLFFKEIKIGL